MRMLIIFLSCLWLTSEVHGAKQCGQGEKCHDSPSHRPSLEKEECGLGSDPTGFIIGGNDTQIGEFPFLALLGRDNITTFHCGGTLINKWYVLTAAHCDKVDYVRLGDWKVVEPDDLSEVEDTGECYYYNEVSRRKCQAKRSKHCSRCIVRDPTVDCMNDKRTKKEFCSKPHQDIPVSEAKAHPEYIQNQQDSGVALNDIMLLKLSRPAEYNDFVQPVCLPSSSMAAYGEPETNFDNNRAMAVGWGKSETVNVNSETPVFNPLQQKLEMPAIGHTDCLTKFSELKLNLTGMIRPERHLCAGGERKHDACKGDSGGPLMGRKDDLSPWQIIGVISGGGPLCGSWGIPALFTRVTKYDQWIKDNMV